MQKIWLLAFSFLIFLLSFVFFSTITYAEAENSATSSGSAENQINYELPYPGLLPDSPLYFLRAIRDRVVGLMISDPLKKSEFDLLQADKRLNAGIYLFNKGKTSLAITTISKAENYFSEALDKMAEAKKQGIDTGPIEGKLRDSLEKHEQELGFLNSKVDANTNSGFEKELKRVTGFEERLKQ